MIARDVQLTADFHESLSALDVGIDEDFWTFDRAINVRLGGEVDDDVGLYLGEEFFDSLFVANVELFETKVGVFKGLF